MISSEKTGSLVLQEKLLTPEAAFEIMNTLDQITLRLPGHLRAHIPRAPHQLYESDEATINSLGWSHFLEKHVRGMREAFLTAVALEPQSEVERRYLELLEDVQILLMQLKDHAQLGLYLQHRLAAEIQEWYLRS